MIYSSDRKQERGFTVIELLIAIGIFGIVIPSLGIAVRNLSVLNNRARDLALINIIASNKAEQIRSSGFNSTPIGTIDFSNELPNEIPSPKSATYTVTSPSAGLLEISIAVQYKDYNRTRSLNYKTIMGELGVGQ